MPLLACIPALPLAAFLYLALGGKRWSAASHRVGILAVGLSFALSVAATVEVARDGALSVPLYRLLSVGDFVVDVGLYLDPMAALVLLLVTGVSLLVHVYSARYMIGDPRYRRFFALIALFTFAMVLLVTSNNLLVSYMAWEIMGLCSYLLISHAAHRPSAGRAATKAFLVNAVADVGLGFGVVLAARTYGTLNIQEILAKAAAAPGESLEILGLAISTNTVIALCLLSGAAGKSAQVPMHVWLPYAMEAPTPVSALIHAATMVNAGPFLLVRFAPLLLLAPAAMAAIAVVGGVTALYGALVSLTQSDIKKSLAYSTISQIGFMIFTCGVGAFAVAIFHLLAHGCMKAYLFLSTGNALTAVGGHGHAPRDLPRGAMGPLAAGSLLLACVAPAVLFAGPYERIWTLQEVPAAAAAFWAIALATVFLTGSYAFRGVVALFGTPVGTGVSARPQVFSLGHLAVVAALTAAGGAFALGLWSWYGSFVGLGGATQSPAPEAAGWSAWLALPFAAALAGWALAYYRHRHPPATPVAERTWAKTAYVHLLNKLYFDELHHAVAVRPTLRLSSWLWRKVDLLCIDGAVLGSAGVGRRFADWLWRVVDLRGADATLLRVGRLGQDAGGSLDRVQPRTLRQHLVIIVCWLAVAIGLAYLLAA